MNKRIYTVALFWCCAVGSAAQKNFTLQLQSMRTSWQQQAMGFAAWYAKPYEEIDFQRNSNRGFVQWSPLVNVQAGSGASFTTAEVKWRGIWMKGDTVRMGGWRTINSRKTFHLFPVAAGVESNHRSIVGLIEAGWVPYYQSRTHARLPLWIRHTRMGWFLQTGNKWRIDSSGLVTGGQAEQGQERAQRWLIRLRSDWEMDTGNILKSSTGIGFYAKLIYWYDLVNAATYRQAILRCRLYLDDARSLDLQWQEGSGAPTFNKGRQWGVGLQLGW